MITSLADAERVFGPLKPPLPLRTEEDWFFIDDNDIIRWAGEEYWVEEKVLQIFLKEEEDADEHYKIPKESLYQFYLKEHNEITQEWTDEDWSNFVSSHEERFIDHAQDIYLRFVEEYNKTLEFEKKR